MAGINTRLLILSDTHADDGQLRLSADVAIHCGDLTEESKLCEFVASIRLLKGIRAPLKLAIAGNHDFTLDTPLFRRKIAEAVPALDPDLVKKEFGEYGEARQLLAAAGIVLLGEGRHQFTLDNGALLTVYASPYTPSPHAEMGFQFKPKDGHNFEIGPGVDVAITHGPPRGVLDMTDSKERGGCEELFAEVARARPRLHCFGHIHEGWGAKSVAWRGREATASPSHFTDIDNGRSATLDTLASFKPGKWDTPELATEKKARLERYTAQGYCSARSGPLHPKEDAAAQTLFVNAAIQSLEEEGPSQLPWLVEMELPQRPAKRRRQSA
ncbi:Metallo-dependent phosphatase-like protein [Chaetomidium leptoderma]|uniref:Metallo-dependent phosphatase-like protein n=1 Tax=Chaetomidium leptoderma TaxID=669021 RepID=A0AAN6VUF2_9PEZI|nr:Metallo-dependent phosphatase-like protein [Chaetomidium leptoderma]